MSDALDELPDDISELMTNVAVTVEDESPRGPNLLGLYEGVPWGRRGPYYAGALPDKITIYRVPLERIAAAIPSDCALWCAAPSSTRSRTTSASATSGWSISTAMIGGRVALGGGNSNGRRGLGVLV